MDDAMRDEAVRLGWRRDWPPNDDGPQEGEHERGDDNRVVPMGQDRTVAVAVGEGTQGSV